MMRTPPRLPSWPLLILLAGCGEEGPSGARSNTGRVPLVHDEEGRVSRESNILAVEGGWFYQSVFDGNELVRDGSCLKGTMFPGTFASYLGFHLCRDRATPDEDDDGLALDACPWSPQLADEFLGVSFDLTGEIPEESHFLFGGTTNEGLFIARPILVTSSGYHALGFDEAGETIDWRDSPDEPTPVLESNKVHEVGLFMPAPDEPTNYDFCIENISIITPSVNQ